MTASTARRLTAVYFALYIVALTWPGVGLANRVRPLVLGLPFNFFWVALWVALSVLVLFGLDRIERRERRERGVED